MKKSFLYTPLAFDTPVRGVFVGISPPPLGRKNQNVSLPDGKKNFEDIFIRFGATHERDRRMDRHCMTAKTAIMHRIAR